MTTRPLGWRLAAGSLAVVLASAAMATEPAAPAASSSTTSRAEPSSDSVALARVPAEEPASAASRAAENDPVVCKRMAVTGSRVKKEKVCRPQSEWGRDSERAKEFMKGMERGGSRGVGGESLPAGG